MQIEIGTCKLETCTVERDGKCVEGSTNLAQCPNYISEPDEEKVDKALVQTDGDEVDTGEETLSTEIPPFDPDTDLEQLHDGSGFDFQSAFDIMRATPTRIIVVAGGNASGKTTLLSSIYELFQKNSFAGYLFTGSLTFRAWEERCHLSRIVSQRAIPDTERTKFWQNDLLHLKISRKNLTCGAQDILFTDLAGEKFRLARDLTKECQKMEFLLRTDHLAVLIDGAKIATLEHRQ